MDSSLLYPSHLEQIILFDKIRDAVKSYCQTDYGQREVDQITFHNDIQTISQQLQITWESVQLVKYNNSAIPALHLTNILPLLQKIAIEGTFLEEAEVLELFHLAQAAVSIEEMIERTDVLRFPLIHAYNRHVKSELLTLRDIIVAYLNPDGSLTDAASVELKRIKEQIYQIQKTINKTLQRIIVQSQSDGISPDNALPTIRDGRFVIPVNTANKRKMKGSVIDESDTGKTSFVEPQEIVEDNNTYKALRWQEYRERLRVLKELTKKIKPYAPLLNECQQYVGYFDFIMAKAHFACAIDAHLPFIQKELIIQWTKVYSPVLLLKHANEKNKVIPFDIHLHHDASRILIISGPNAGGKSVCLKTTALIQYMVQCGLLPPICENSKVGIFDKILMDVGDEQSIQDDLSTYSAHLNNMNHMLEHASTGSLFFIDEAGNGTEPSYGGAIAQSVLETLAQTGSLGVVTTHFSNIKMLATQNPIFCNAAMLFDPHNLQPTYRMTIGKPGDSYAIEIAQKIGIPASILQNAERKIGKDKIDYDRLINELTKEKQLLQQEKEKYDHDLTQLSQLISHYQNQTNQLKTQKKIILQEAQQQAQSLLTKSNAVIEKTIKEIKETQADKERTIQARERIQKLKSSIPITEQQIPKPQKRILHDFSELKPEKISTHKQESSVISSIKNRQMRFSPTIDMRGMKADEALQTFMNYLDDAIMVNAQQIQVIHGTGTGALKQVIRNYLYQFNKKRQKTGKSVVEFADGDVNTGGAGVTIVNIS